MNSPCRAVRFWVAGLLALLLLAVGATTSASTLLPLRADAETSAPEVTILARDAERLPNTSNVLFHRLEGESIVMSLDFEGIAVSTGSACSSGSLEPSHVILALGFDHAYAQGSIRFSLSRYTTLQDIDYTLEKLPPIIHRLRNISAL